MKQFQVSQENNYILNLRTRIFLDAAIPLFQHYQETASTSYNADITPTYFQDQSNATKTINSWINEATKGNDKELVTEGTYL